MIHQMFQLVNYNHIETTLEIFCYLLFDLFFFCKGLLKDVPNPELLLSASPISHDDLVMVSKILFTI